MKKIILPLLLCLFCFGSEDVLLEKLRQLTQEEYELLRQSQSQQDSTKSPKKSLRGSTQIGNGGFDPYLGYGTSKKKKKDQDIEIVSNQDWIYGTAVITTTFLDGSIKRSYGILLRDGMYLTSANMVYNQDVYARSSYAMMQDDSTPPFVCIAKLSIKALDLQMGLAVLETSEYTDAYCNVREKTFYHDRIYTKNWVDVFNQIDTGLEKKYTTLYSATISPLNSFLTKKTRIDGDLKKLAREKSTNFSGYKYSYGKGYYTREGKLVGIIAAKNDDDPFFVKTKQISEFLCGLKDKKILENRYLKILCPSPK